ncbi:hypothetical protein [Stutzerimonas urumqiensis]|uniref:hypothetical protein n=1 Tax=Stutzerimonas urumqiensis TaxID=638269 RepID=UPI000EB357C6|nr:hypothetical protein [Stutzerimonas urumqiensis]
MQRFDGLEALQEARTHGENTGAWLRERTLRAEVGGLEKLRQQAGSYKKASWLGASSEARSVACKSQLAGDRLVATDSPTLVKRS